MEKILVVDLTTKKVISQDYDVKNYGHYGRGLALDLIRKIVPSQAGRYSKENAIAFVPGLFTGCKVASACRLMIMTKKDRNEGIQLSNTTGNLPQKMGALSIAALVVKGESEERNAVLHISNDGVEIVNMPELENTMTSSMIRILKERFGVNAGIVAVGKTADMQMSLSTFVCTYPDGEPEYHCPRSGFGDVFGSKGLRAVVITSKKSFDRECFDEEKFLSTGKDFAKLIINNEICGGALPAYGSVTLIRLLKDKEKVLASIKDKKTEDIKPKRTDSIKSKQIDTNKTENAYKSNKKVNFCCAPMCVIGCLNRHSINDGQVYSSPDESEVHEALKSCYKLDDYEYTKLLRNKAYELGIVGTEFVTASKMYFEATGLQWSKQEILKLLDEIEKGSVIGRVVASRTYGIKKLFSENKNLIPLLDRKAIDDEDDFKVSITKFNDELKDMSDMDLLYAQIFVLENLGFCIFSSFATVNSEESFELMSKLFTYKTGIEITPVELINYARSCMEMEKEYEKENSINNIQNNIPPFTKVLYRYFAKI